MAFLRRSERDWGTGDVFPSCQKRCHDGNSPPQRKRTDGPENAKTPPERGFLACAEEDSNLHPVNPDQALNLARLPIPPSARGRGSIATTRPWARRAPAAAKALQR